MRKRGRVWRVGKWAGVVGCLALLVTHVASQDEWIEWTSRSGRQIVSLEPGAVVLSFAGADSDGEAGLALQTSGIRHESYRGPRPANRWWFRIDSNRAWTSIHVPLWVPLLILSAITGVVWYWSRGRRRDRPAVRWLATVATMAFVALWIVAGYSPASVLHGDRNFCLSQGCLEWLIPEHSTWRSTFSDDTLVPIPTVFDAGLRWPNMRRAPGWGTQVVLPLWIPAAIAALASAMFWQRRAIIAWRSRSEGRAGYCRQCGYDLTLNVSGTCPECGVACEKAEVIVNVKL